MKTEKLQELLRSGEGLEIEFKQSRHKLNKNIFQTVCAFLNRNGGYLFLGVDDNGKAIGVSTENIEKIKKNFVTSMNNPQIISPTFYLTVEEIVIQGNTILYIFVPASSQVHRCNGKIYDRNEDGDIDITENTNLVTDMYIRKQTFYTENRIYPFAQMADLRSDLFTKIRKLAANQRPNHPWKSMNDMELLKSA